jgi:hypothetical protein
MTTSACIRDDLRPAGLDWITCLHEPAIEALATRMDRCNCPLFDDGNLAEIGTPDMSPGERLIVCRNRDLAAERARKREGLLTATERDLSPEPHPGADQPQECSSHDGDGDRDGRIKRARNDPGLQGSIASRTHLPLHEDRRSRHPARPSLDGRTGACPRLPLGKVQLLTGAIKSVAICVTSRKVPPRSACARRG